MKGTLPLVIVFFVSASLSAAPASLAAQHPAPSPPASYTPPNNPSWPAGTPIGRDWPPEYDLVRFPPLWLAEQRLALFEARVDEIEALLDSGLVPPALHPDIGELLSYTQRQALAWEHLVLAHRAARLPDARVRHYGVRYHLDDLRLNLGAWDYGRGLLPDVPL
jgi:hypothetical protein